MPPYFWSAVHPSKPDPVKDEIRSIGTKLVSHELWNVFEKRVKRTRKIHPAEVEVIVMDTSKKIENLPEMDIYHGHNLESFEAARDFLKDALAQLHALEKRTERKAHKDLKEQEEAIRADQNAFDTDRKAAEPLQLIQSRNLRFIEINTNVDVPTKTIHETTGRYITYLDLVDCLIRANVVTKLPDFWIKRESKITIPDDIAQWKHRYGTTKIDADEIFFTCQGNEYVIVAVHERGEAKPVAVKLPGFGTGPSCCVVQCKNLGEHLQSIWPEYRVECARPFKDPGNPFVLVTAFDNRIYKSKKNELYVYCSRG